MVRQKLVSLAVTLIASVGLLPGTVLGGGWAIVTLDRLPEDIVTGQETMIGYTVLQHGKEPVSGLTTTVKLVNPESGERVSVRASGDGPQGHYAARIVLPRAGTWEWAIDAFNGDHPMPALTVRAAAMSNAADVSPAVVAEVVPSTSAPAAVVQDARPMEAATPWWRWAALTVGITFTLAGSWLTWTDRRARRAIPAAAIS